MGVIEEYRDAVAAERRAFEVLLGFRPYQRGRPTASFQMQRARMRADAAARAVANEALGDWEQLLAAENG